MSSKRFTVMLHYEGERRLERDVQCYSVNDLMNQLERRIGYRIREAHFFNPYTDSYQVLTQHDFETIPRNVELQIFLDSDRRDVGPSALMQTSKHQLTYKARVIECLRKLLLPLYNANVVSKDEMIAACSQLCREYIERRGLDDAELQSQKREVTLREQELLRQMVKAYKQAALPEYDDAPQRVSLVDRDDHVASQRHRLRTGTGTTTRTRGVRPIAGRHDYYGAGAPAAAASLRGHSSRASSAYGRHAAAGIGERLPSHSELFPRGPNLHRDHTTYFRQPSDRQYESVSPSPPRDGSGDAVPALPSSSMFQAVSYTVAGTFPSIPPGNARIGDSNLRCSLTTPVLSDADQDVIVSGTVHSASSVTLCWWLAYGPQRIVLNLDKMYTSQLVTTYQVSDTALILAFRSGSLVPGWEYFVHLTVTSNSGTTAMAQTSFAVPNIGGGEKKMPSIGSQASANDMIRGGLGGVTSTYNSRTLGYFADSERGRMAQASPPKQGGSPNASPQAATSVVTDSPRSPRSAPASRGAAAAAAATATAVPMEFLDGSGRVVVAQRGGSGPAESAPGTYQEQLRAFFTNQIEPLYFLSNNPSMSEDQFRTLVKDCAKRFWFRHPPEHQLDDETRREIVVDIKQTISSARARAGL